MRGCRGARALSSSLSVCVCVCVCVCVPRVLAKVIIPIMLQLRGSTILSCACALVCVWGGEQYYRGRPVWVQGPVVA